MFHIAALMMEIANGSATSEPKISITALNLGGKTPAVVMDNTVAILMVGGRSAPVFACVWLAD